MKSRSAINPARRIYRKRNSLQPSLFRAVSSIAVFLSGSLAGFAQVVPSGLPTGNAYVSKVTLPDAPRPADSMLAAAQLLPEEPAATSHQDVHQDEQVTLRRLPARFLSDEWHVVSSPARIRTSDLKWLLPLAGASAAAFATDTHTMRDVVSRDTGFNGANNTSSDVLRGIAIGVPVLLFGAGQVAGDEHARESGLLAGEAMIDGYVFSEVVKYCTLRERPSKDNARGRFFVGDASSDPSFISGHSIVAWSSAAVLAGEYRKPWQQGVIYSLATGASLTRVLGQQHSPSDALPGSAAGWLIGHYVYRAHHRHFAN